MSADMEKLREALERIANDATPDAAAYESRGHWMQAIAIKALAQLSPSSGEGGEEPMPWNEIDRAVALARWTLQDHEAFKLHPTTAKMVRTFAFALAQKLRAAEEKYGYSDGWRTLDWETECQRQLHVHADKGDPLDVAAYAAFCWARRWSTELPPSPATVSPALAEEVARIIAGDFAADCAADKDLIALKWSEWNEALAKANAIIPVVLKASQSADRYADEYMSVSIDRDGQVQSHNAFDASFDQMVEATQAIITNLQSRLDNRLKCPFASGKTLRGTAPLKVNPHDR